MKGVLSEKVINRHVVKLHRGQPHIRTEVTFLTPIKEEDVFKFNTLLLVNKMNETISEMVEKVEEEVGDTFECDIESIHLNINHIL